jgi:hypothetical protein
MIRPSQPYKLDKSSERKFSMKKVYIIISLLMGLNATSMAKEIPKDQLNLYRETVVRASHEHRMKSGYSDCFVTYHRDGYPIENLYNYVDEIPKSYYFFTREDWSKNVETKDGALLITLSGPVETDSNEHYRYEYTLSPDASTLKSVSFEKSHMGLVTTVANQMPNQKLILDMTTECSSDF